MTNKTFSKYFDTVWGQSFTNLKGRGLNFDISK